MNRLDNTSPGAQRPRSRGWPSYDAKLLLREPIPLFWGIAFPMILLGVMGAFSGGPDSGPGWAPAGRGLRADSRGVRHRHLRAAGTARLCSPATGNEGFSAGYDTTPVGVHRVLAAQLNGQPGGGDDRDRRASSSSVGSLSGWNSRFSPRASSLPWYWPPPPCWPSDC